MGDASKPEEVLALEARAAKAQARWERRLKAAPALAGLGALIWLFVILGPMATGLEGWGSLLQFGGAVAIAFGVAALVRYSLKPFLPAEAPPPQPSMASVDATRDRLGPIVLGIGTLAIAILAVALIIAFYKLALDVEIPNNPIPAKIDSLLMGIFTSVLPIFATWVGTVLAFYFTKESFRQAAQSSLEAVQGVKPQPLAIERMIQYDHIGKIVEGEIKAPDGTTEIKTEEIPMTEIFNRFTDATTMCLIFDKKKTPLYIIRNKTPPMPNEWRADKGSGKKISDYLMHHDGNNAKDAKKFDFLARNATLEAARTKMATMDGDDLFITETGAASEPVLGWIPRDKLK